VRAIQVGICILIAFAVLAFGGAEPWGEAILEIGAAALLVLWGTTMIRQGQLEIHGNWLYIPVLGLAGFSLGQAMLGFSIYPFATKMELLRWGTYIILCFLSVESFRTERELKAFAWFLASLGFIVSLFGIVQHFTFNGKLYWFVALDQNGGAFGPFVYHNHFAGFVELVAPFGLALIFSGRVSKERLPVLSLFTIVPTAALVLSASRGGIASFLFEVALLALLLSVRKERGKRLPIAACLLIVTGVVLVWLGIGSTVERFEQLFGTDGPATGRVLLSKDAWQIFVHHLWTGTGLGTFETAYPRYASAYNGLRLDHAHNDYFELLADTGLIGGAFGLAFIALLFWFGFANFRSAQNPGVRAFYGAALAACAGILLHSFVDFNLHLPSNALLFLILAGLATSRRPTPQPICGRSSGLR
jgi:O-antigen ligase